MSLPEADGDRPSIVDVHLEVVASNKQQVLRQLLEFNAYEFSRFDQASLGLDGTYGYRYFDAYWSEVGRVPFFILAGDELAGFALVRQNQ